MQQIAPSELILNNRGAIYHLDLLPDEIAENIITVGDPSRVQEVSKHFDAIEVRRSHREFVTHTGRLGSKRISVVSTGIGTDNIDIVLNEIDALLNIDMQTKCIKKDITEVKIIRIGTSGSLQSDVPVDSFVASTHGIGLDNLMNFYLQNNNDEEKQLLHAFATQTQLHNRLCYPYIASASMLLMKYFVQDFHQGITVTCPGFYGPQGRVLRLGTATPHLIESLTKFQFGQHRVTNFEMETSGLYGLSKLLRHHCVSLSVIIANRIHKNFSNDIAGNVEKLIKKTLEVFSEKI